MARKDTPRGYQGPTHSMLEVCEVQFEHLDDRLAEIKRSIDDLQPHLFNLPVTIGKALREHMHDCPAYSRTISRVVRPSNTPPQGTAMVMDDNARLPRIPRWLKYLLGVGSLLGGVVVAILQYYGIM